MIWIVLCLVALVLLWVGGSLRYHQDRLDAISNAARNSRRRADERWQLLQERHDAVIELIANIPECPCGKHPYEPPIIEDKPKPRKKAK